MEDEQQAPESLVRGIMVGISKDSGKDFVLPLYLELPEIAAEVILLTEAPREGKLVKQRAWGYLRAALVVQT